MLMPTDKARLTTTAGMAIRGQLKREITKAAWRYGLEVHVEEAKGLLESTYRFTFRGTNARRFASVCKRWIDSLDY
jgi:hypothetical protein